MHMNLLGRDGIVADMGIGAVEATNTQRPAGSGKWLTPALWDSDVHPVFRRTGLALAGDSAVPPTDETLRAFVAEPHTEGTVRRPLLDRLIDPGSCCQSLEADVS
jgi:hypothetical protein